MYPEKQSLSGRYSFLQWKISTSAQPTHMQRKDQLYQGTEIFPQHPKPKLLKMKCKEES